GNEEDVLIAIVSGGCYAFAVLALAVYTVGGVVVPLSPRVHPDEAKYFLETCKASLICAVPATTTLVQSISQTLSLDIPIYTYTPEKRESLICNPNSSEIRFYITDSPPPHPATKGFVLLYTSGTTGPPKGILHDRSTTTGGFLSRFSKPLQPSAGNVYLHHMPVHWAGGFMTFLSGILSKACVEFCSEVFSARWFLERIRARSRPSGRWELPAVASLHLPPPLLNDVVAELEDLKNKDPDGYTGVLEGIRNLKDLASGGSTVTPKQRVLWHGLLKKPLVVGYGMSEHFGVVAFTDYRKRGEYPLLICGLISGQDSVGICMPNVNMKIDENGEICIKSPVLFKKYISPDSSLTSHSFDSEGFFKTGDLGKVEDGVVYLLGRASQDVIRYYLWRIYAPEVESALSQIDEIAHAVVLGVNDSGCGQRVAAVVVYRQRDESGTQGLEEIRRKLSMDIGLEMFKLPTLLKIVASSSDIPVSEAGKPIKNKILELYFGEAAVARGDVEVWTSDLKDGGVRGRPFDWDGLQR
ncbi:Malonate--CoA ligase, partial [Penicillium rolfsii]